MRAVDKQTRLREFVTDCGGQKAAAVKLGVSPQFVWQMVHGLKTVPDAMLDKLGLKRVVVQK